MLSCAVVGCGPAGMAVAASLRRAGLMVTVFEMGPTAGGMWAADAACTHTDRGLLAPIPPSMRCVIPKDLMAFSDMPMYASTPSFPHHSAVADYLRRYAEQRGVNAITRFNTKVESVRFDEKTGQWKLISVGLVNADAYEWAFDRVVVATGQAHAPRYPEEAHLLKSFSEVGTVTHSCFVKQPREFARRRVVVVGDGVSAYDMCQQLLQVGANVMHSTMMERVADPAMPFFSFEGLAAAKGDTAGYCRKHANLTGLFASLPFKGSREHHANEIIAGLMRHREGYKAPRRVGRIIKAEGKDLLVHDDPTRVLSTAQIMEELDTMGKGGGSALGASAPKEELLTNVDAVIFATGFHTKYPFLPPEMRSALETRPAQPQIEGGKEEEEENSSSSSSSSSSAVPSLATNKGLYRGCLWAANPTIGIVGRLPDALPPFMVMEAQGSFLGRALTGKNPTVRSEAQMEADDSLLLSKYPDLSTFFPERGLGLTSTQYYNALMEDRPTVGVVPVMTEPRSFSEAIYRRKWWFAQTWVVQTVNKVRTLAPLKRKQQHVLFSNKI